MKTQLSTAHQTLVDNSTPFIVCTMGDHELRLYWTKSYNVLGLVWGPYDQERGTCLVSQHVSTGGGYCKTDHILALLFNDLGVKPKGMDLGGSDIPWKYKVGGNYWNIPKSDIRKIS